MKRLASFLITYRYSISCFTLMVLMTFHTINGHHLGGDIWSHSAAVRELATNLFSPSHSHYLVDTPTILYSPYSVGIAFFSRLTQLDAVTLLSIAGILNLILFLYSLRLFVSLLIPKYSEAAAFYALLFIMLLWGNDAWLKSGFYHIRVLGSVLQLPSAFGFSLALLALSMFMLFIKNRNRTWLIPLAVISTVVLISHPLSFIFLFVGIVSLSVGIRRLSYADYGLLVFIFVIILSAAAVWPYAPFLKLLFLKSTKTYSSSSVSKTLYQGVIGRIFPTLIGIPFLFFRMRANKLDPLGIMFVLSCAIYACGAIFEKWTFGRMISFMVLVLQISTAGGIAQIELRLEKYCQNVKRKNGAENFWKYTGIFILSGALVWGSKKLLWPNVQTALQLKVLLFISVALSSFVLTWFLFRPSGWFCNRSTLAKRFVYFCLILLTSLVFSFNSYVRPALAGLRIASENNYTKYLFVRDYIGQYDVVLSDIYTNGIIPTFGGKVIAVANTPVSIPDNRARIKDVTIFFNTKTSFQEQLKIIQKYGADFLLIYKPYVESWPTIIKPFLSINNVLYSDNDFILISLDPHKEE